MPTESTATHPANQIHNFVEKLIKFKIFLYILSSVCFVSMIVLTFIYAYFGRNFPHRYILFYSLVAFFPISSAFGIYFVSNESEQKPQRKVLSGQSENESGNDEHGFGEASSLSVQNYINFSPKRTKATAVKHTEFPRLFPKPVQKVEMILEASDLRNSQNLADNHITIDRQTVSFTDPTHNRISAEYTFDITSASNVKQIEESEVKS